MKIAGVVIAAAIVLFAAFMIFAMTDWMSNLATGSETLKPDGATTGKALVVYNPGFSGATKDTAAKIAGDLKARGYEVCLAGVSSSAAANVSGYDVIVAGGPVYGGKVSGSVWSYLVALVPPASAKVGAFALGENTLDRPFPDAAWLKATAILPPQKNTDIERAQFVTDLLE
jgi:flavodoxin